MVFFCHILALAGHELACFLERNKLVHVRSGRLPSLSTPKALRRLPQERKGVEGQNAMICFSVLTQGYFAAGHTSVKLKAMSLLDLRASSYSGPV